MTFFCERDRTNFRRISFCQPLVVVLTLAVFFSPGWGQQELIGNWTGRLEESRKKNDSFFRSMEKVLEDKAAAEHSCNITLGLFNIQFWQDPDTNQIQFDKRNLAGIDYHFGIVKVVEATEEKLVIRLESEGQRRPTETVDVNFANEGNKAEFDFEGLVYVAERSKVEAVPEAIQENLMGEWQFGIEKSSSIWQSQKIDFKRLTGTSQKSWVRRLGRLALKCDKEKLSLTIYSSENVLTIPWSESVVFRDKREWIVSFPVKSTARVNRFLLISRDEGQTWNLSMPRFPLVALKKKP